MRKALLIGINKYKKQPLKGCENDAEQMACLLSEHANGDPNFDCKVVTSKNFATDRKTIRGKLEEWYQGEADISLLFFSGHGALTSSGGFLVTSDAEKYNEGVSMTDVLILANKAARERRHRQVIIILDCCHSGAFGNLLIDYSHSAYLEEGVVVLTASGKNEHAKEGNGNGLLTSILLEALEGGASDILGKVTLSSLYSCADQLFDAWNQRPRLKSNVQKMVTIRRNKPKIELKSLRKIIEYFPTKEHKFPLNNTYEPFDTDGVSKNPEAIDENILVFRELQRFNRLGLLKPYGLSQEEDYMYFAAIRGTGCELTLMGKFYWRMAKRQRF